MPYSGDIDYAVHPSVEVLTEVQFAQPGVGHFPLLADDASVVLHGFTWGANALNMAYRQRGDVSPDVITARNERFLHALGMAPLRQAVIIEAIIGVPGENRLPVDVDAQFLETTPSTEKGLFTPSHIVFTELPCQPIAIKPGDCPVAMVAGKNDYGGQVVGIIHSSRNELAEGLLGVAVDHLRGRYRCDISQLRFGIVPSLGSVHHFIQAADVARTVPNFGAWGRFRKDGENGGVHLNASGLFVQQLIEAGVNPRNIQLYGIDTYTAAANRVGFSHRYSSMNNSQRTGRFMLAIQSGA